MSHTYQKIDASSSIWLLRGMRLKLIN